METSHSLGDTYDPLGSGRGGPTSFPCGIYLTGMGGGASFSLFPVGQSCCLGGVRISFARRRKPSER